MGTAASLLLGCGAGGKRRGPGRMGLSARDQMVLVKGLPGGGSGLGAPFSAAVQSGEVGEARGTGSSRAAAGVRRCPASSLRPARCRLAALPGSFATPKRPGSAAPVSRLALARRPPRAPPAHRRLGNSFGIFLQTRFVSLQRQL